MSCGILIKPYKGSIYFNGIEPRSYHEVEDMIENEEAYIDSAKEQIMQICACTPKDMFPSDEDGDTFFKLNDEVNNLFESIRMSYSNLTSLYAIKAIVDEYTYDQESNIDPHTIEGWKSISISNN